MKQNKYEHLLNSDGSLKYIVNGQDAYVELSIEGESFMIPVSMPRRRPDLKFDLLHPNDELWDYLDQCCMELSCSNVKKWRELQLLELKQLGSVSKANQLLCELISNHCVCYSCYSQKQEGGNPNPQKNIQYLRDRGFIICTLHRRCDRCNATTTMYFLTPVLKSYSQKYETIPKALKEKICKVLGYTDIYTGSEYYNPNTFTPDHKFPEDRWDENTPSDNSIDMSDDQIRAKFQLLSPQTNMQKKEFCSLCIKTGKRGYPFGIKYYYQGTEDWDPSIPVKGNDAERGCVGCGWYDFAEWRKALNGHLSGELEKK